MSTSYARSIRLACLVALPTGAAEAAPTILRFDDLTPGTIVTNQYGPLGVRFYSAYADTDTGARSGQGVLRVDNPVNEFHEWPMRIDFSAGQRTVKLYAGRGAGTATLTAYDANGAVMGSDGPRPVSADAHVTLFGITKPNAVIRRVDLHYQGTGFESIDDLEYDGEPAPGVPTTPPRVVISAPASNARPAREPITVGGVVRGAQVDPQASMRVEVRRPQGSTAPSTYSYPLTLSGAGTVHRFSIPLPLRLGPQTITVTAENSGALSGSASVVVDYLPPAIRRRSVQEGGARTLGPFLFGGPAGGATPACAYAVYQNGSISLASGRTYVVRGPLFQKWLSLQDESRFPELGCAVGKLRATIRDASAQDFQGGRLYARGSEAFLVPTVFAGAIDALGGEAATGVPVADATADSRTPFKTWRLQRFEKSGADVPSTLEIRGDPPRLFVERQAGDGSLFEGVLRPNNATLVQSFECTTTAGPCSVAPPAAETPFPLAGEYCHNQKFSFGEMLAHVTLGTLDSSYVPDPPEWVAPHGHYGMEDLWGVVKASHLASKDNPFAHEHTFEPCPLNLRPEDEFEDICPSDWEVIVRPLPGSRRLMVQGVEDMGIEFEYDWFLRFMDGWGEPIPGDVVLASGRFIVDCGHSDPFRSEIHPPSILVVVHGATHNGRPATQADIWVNALFPGGTKEFTIDPPPRPSPQAIIGLTYPAEPGIRVSLSFEADPTFGPVRVRVTAPERHPKVSNLGEMKWPKEGIPGGYEGRLLVYWNE
jgi:hypothetical protein